MSFAIGTPDFGVIDIERTDVGRALQVFVSRGSKLTGVDISSININLAKEPEGLESGTVTGLLNCGMKLFDACAWLSLPSDKRPALKVAQDFPVENIPSMARVATCTFYVYFFLLTQARYPVTAASEEKPKIPAFLRTLMGLTEDQGVYVKELCSFNPNTFDKGWIQHVKFNGFGQEALSRFGLGVAGYRLFAPFKLYEPSRDLPANLKSAYLFASTVAKTSPTWAIHPVTRDPAVLAKRGNLNKNLGNLILECFSAADIDEMVKAKVLYAKPAVEPNHRQYKTWSDVDDISGNANIFSATV